MNCCISSLAARLALTRRVCLETSSSGFGCLFPRLRGSFFRGPGALSSRTPHSFSFSTTHLFRAAHRSLPASASMAADSSSATRSGPVHLLAASLGTRPSHPHQQRHPSGPVRVGSRSLHFPESPVCFAHAVSILSFACCLMVIFSSHWQEAKACSTDSPLSSPASQQMGQLPPLRYPL